jgi:hypothetical protein
MGSEYPYQHERWDLLDSRSKQSQIRQQDGAQPSKLPPGTYDCGSQNSYTSSGRASSAETVIDCFKTDLGILQFSGESFLSSGFSQFPRQFESFASSEHNGLIMEAQYFTTHHEAYGQDQFIHASDPYQLPNTEFKLDPRMDYGERLSRNQPLAYFPVHSRKATNNCRVREYHGRWKTLRCRISCRKCIHTARSAFDQPTQLPIHQHQMSLQTHTLL